MGLFNLFKKGNEKKEVEDFDVSTLFTSEEMVSINTFRKEYIWGFTQGNPMRHSNDKDAFYNLITPLTGINGTLTIGASFHPYQIIDKSGTDIWELVYNVVKANNFCDYVKLIKEKYFFHMNPPSPEAFPFNIWSDERLLNEVNPEFSKYVPFVIPYLTFENGKEPQWLSELNIGIKTKGNAQQFIDDINNASRFIMPAPTLIIGFGQFEKNKPSSLIDNFVNFLDQNIKKK